MSDDLGSVREDFGSDMIHVTFRCTCCGHDNSITMTGVYAAIHVSAYSEPHVECAQCGYHHPLSHFRFKRPVR